MFVTHKRFALFFFFAVLLRKLTIVLKNGNLVVWPIYTCLVLCLLYTYWDNHHFGSLFISNLSKMLKFAATHHETGQKVITKSKYQLIC